MSIEDLEKLYEVSYRAEEKPALLDWLLIEPGFKGTPSDGEYALMDAVRCRESGDRFRRRMTVLTLVMDRYKIDRLTCNQTAFPRVSDSVEEYLSANGLFDPIKIDRAVGTNVISIKSQDQPENNPPGSENPKFDLSYGMVYFFKHHLAPHDLYALYRDRYVNITNQILDLLGQQKIPPYNLLNATRLNIR